jgi:hypothetical protein
MNGSLNMRILYRLMLRLYPPNHRSGFSAEMIQVFEEARAQARQQSLRGRIAFHFREVFGLLADVFRAHLEVAASSPESWFRSIEAPITGAILFSFWIGQMQELGVHGFFFPGTYAVVAIVGSIAVWTAARQCRFVSSQRNLRRAIVVALLCGAAVPVAAKGAEEAWVRFIAHRERPFHYRLPGLEVTAHIAHLQDRNPGLPDRKGLTFRRIVELPNDMTMTMIHHRDRNAPSYTVLGGILAAALALWSRRTTTLVLPQASGGDV